jgi:hypothetical protein
MGMTPEHAGAFYALTNSVPNAGSCGSMSPILPVTSRWTENGAVKTRAIKAKCPSAHVSTHTKHRAESFPTDLLQIRAFVASCSEEGTKPSLP